MANVLHFDSMTTILPSKKEIERSHLDRFAALFLGFPAGPIESSQEPDFIVYAGSKYY
jgi:hypothetical protein